jgi:hypothetical protein
MPARKAVICNPARNINILRKRDGHKLAGSGWTGTFFAALRCIVQAWRKNLVSISKANCRTLSIARRWTTHRRHTSRKKKEM